MWKFKTPGIPDSEFVRDEGVPITKEEVRAVQISKARLMPGYTVHDIGCGSGSVTVEAALQVEKSGRVYAVDIDPRAVKLTGQNLSKFGITNVDIVEGDALEKIDGLPVADAIFVGGTGGDTRDIVVRCHDRIKPGGRIVIGVILIETLFATLEAIREAPYGDIDITQVTISKSRKTSTGTMMLARNPVTIISATRT